LGISACGAGDLNADGYDDVVVGAHRMEDDKGHAYIFNGGPGLIGSFLPTDADAIIVGPAIDAYFGLMCHSADDVNEDGYDDVIITAQESSDVIGSARGSAYIFFGSAAGVTSCDLSSGCSVGSPSHPGAVIRGTTDLGAFGYWSSSAGDLNGDGVGDLVIGAYGISAPVIGKTFIFYGRSDFSGAMNDNDADNVLTGKDPTQWFGVSTGGLNDINGDGYGDIVVGATGDGTARGECFLFYGSPSGIPDCDLSAGCVPPVTFTGYNDGDSFGWAR
jgi:hypothetical protein